MASAVPSSPNMQKLEQIVSRLPEAVRVDIEAWGGEPTFRVNGKNFIFANPQATSLSVKLPKEEAEAVVATDPKAVPTGYGLGRAGWVSVEIGKRISKARWLEIEEWVRTSYTLVAPKRLAKSVIESDELETSWHPHEHQ
jgi:predicted DNA-binding protein (MmcQ/YjbR family)